MKTPSDDEIVEVASQSLPADPAVYTLVETAVTDGPAIETGTRPSIETDPPVVFEDTYYDLSRSATQVGQQVEVAIAVDNAAGSPDDEDTIAFDALPAVDRDLLDQIVPPPDEDDDRPPVAETVYEDETIEDSVLVLDLEYAAVSRDGRRYPIEQVELSPRPRYEYQYDATAITTSDAAFLEWVRSTYQFELSGLSDAEREIVDEAIDEEYYEGPSTDGFESLHDRLRSHRAVTQHERGGVWLLTYRGTEYQVSITHLLSDHDE